jgi:hypothetical protein
VAGTITAVTDIDAKILYASPTQHDQIWACRYLLRFLSDAILNFPFCASSCPMLFFYNSILPANLWAKYRTLYWKFASLLFQHNH